MKNILKNQLTLWAIFGMIVFVSGCTSRQQQAQNTTEMEQLEEEVIAVHDVAMGRMDEIMHLKQQLQAKAGDADTASEQKVTQSIQDLEAADKAMMDWMRDMKAFYAEEDSMGETIDTMRIKAKTEYLKEEKENIKNIDRQMVTAIEEAKKMLAE